MLHTEGYVVTLHEVLTKSLSAWGTLVVADEIEVICRQNMIKKTYKTMYVR